ncbi:MAG: protein arginine kinase [Defluviitaleaceae bacterium]|nr:protein arginine kinase [Defluviitaleaceae bacterium]MCL2274654.1 protein arginine kinase [Defluviitaleaceae bacterium]MCL2275785.1 protein arginine kinase [Defluviitaleaceae bacterium]
MSAPWFTRAVTDESPILSSRVRLARNLRRYPFQQKLNAPNAAAMVQEIQAIGTHFHKMDMQHLSDAEQKVFLEKHIVSPEFLRGKLPRGLMISDDQNLSVMLNEEDHVRIQSVQAGDALPEALLAANQVDDLIEETHEYAFNAEHGYLTACPTNTGTGLRASYMIHLPFLERTDKFKSLLPAITKLGITLRGIYGEGTESMGSIYQISNQTTLGKTEEEIIHALQKTTQQVMEHEAQARDTMLITHRPDQENMIYRAYGVLAYSRKITAKEAMDLLSEIRIGYLYSILDKPKPEKQIYQIMMEIQPGHLQRVAGREMNELERDYARAEYLREIFC